MSVTDVDCDHFLMVRHVLTVAQCLLFKCRVDTFGFVVKTPVKQWEHEQSSKITLREQFKMFLAPAHCVPLFFDTEHFNIQHFQHCKLALR